MRERSSGRGWELDQTGALLKCPYEWEHASQTKQQYDDVPPLMLHFFLNNKKNAAEILAEDTT